MHETGGQVMWSVTTSSTTMLCAKDIDGDEFIVPLIVDTYLYESSGVEGEEKKEIKKYWLVHRGSDGMRFELTKEVYEQIKKEILHPPK